MSKTPKTEQLQVRVSPSQKLAIKKQAAQAQMSMSEWILNKVLPSSPMSFQQLIGDLARSEKPGYVFAELLETIGAMSAHEFELAASEPPEVQLNPYWQNYLAATLEHAAALKHAKAPSWVRDVAPLEQPAFGSSLKGLRLHLLVNSPPSFIARNIFVDSTVGDRV